MYADEIPLEDENTPEIVHWFDRPPMHLSPIQLSAAVAGAFILGAATTVALLALGGRLRD